VDDLLFGDVVVVLSEWMRARMLGSGVDGSLLRVIPPCAEAPVPPSHEAIERTRARYALGAARVVLYPGDYEVSTGAATFADAVRLLADEVADVTFVYACREKTSRAGEAREKLVKELARDGLETRVRHVGEIVDLPALMAASSAIAFPVDDLYGKVDLPLVLLEALALGIPLVLARGGPLEAIPSAAFVEPGDGAALASALAQLLADAGVAAEQVRRGRELYLGSFTPEVVANRYDDLYEEILTP
jgi:phosphatidylinositol alpha-1,6-mannosyltransferase